MIPTDTHKQSPQRSYSLRYCIRCETDRPAKGGTYSAGRLLFTCLLHKTTQLKEPA